MSNIKIDTKSKCCNANVKSALSEADKGSTNYNVCEQCNNPCDIVMPETLKMYPTILPMSLNDLSKMIYANAVQKGFYEDGKSTNIGERIALIHSELSEALEADRKDKYTVCGSLTKELEKGPPPTLKLTEDEFFFVSFAIHVKDTFEDEMADALIRILDMCAHKKIDIDWHVAMKMRYNSLREKYHGKKY